MANATAPLREQFDARVVPRNATELRVPQASFRVRNWSSDSGWVKLLEIPEDGAAVKEGDLIGKFEFMGRNALPYVQNIIQTAEAGRDQAFVSEGAVLDEMLARQEQLELGALKAELDTRKEGVVSARDLRRFGIAYEQAQFEERAQRQQLGAHKQATKAERDYHKQNVDSAQSVMVHYKAYEKRFTVRAPHDGVVRHAFFARRGRKVQRGDGLPAGMHFVSVARDEALAVDIYIPEHRYALTRSQRRFLVRSPSSSATYEVEVEQVSPFPQEVGFLLQNDNLPNAREKVYVLRARLLDERYEELGAGQEVKVSLP